MTIVISFLREKNGAAQVSDLCQDWKSGLVSGRVFRGRSGLTGRDSVGQRSALPDVSGSWSWFMSTFTIKTVRGTTSDPSGGAMTGSLVFFLTRFLLEVIPYLYSEALT